MVDPLQFEISIGDYDLIEYEPVYAWESLPATEKQIAYLNKCGIICENMCKGKASKIIDRLSKRRMAGYCTPKQIKTLERYGFHDVGEWSFDDASNMIGQIAVNSWRVPIHINPKIYKPIQKGSIAW